MLTRLQSFRDIVVYVSRSEWVYVLAATATVFGVATSLPVWHPLVGVGLAAVGTLAGSVVFLRDTQVLQQRWKKWTFRRMSPAIPPGAALTVPGLPTVLDLEQGIAAVNDDLDDRLASSTIPLMWDASSYRLPEELRELAPHAFRRSTTARLPTNGPCVRMDTDLDAIVDDPTRPAHLRAASFFDALASNELTALAITRDGIDFQFQDRFLFDESGCVRRLSNSTLANIVGVSTLALTSDDQILVVLQSARSSASAQKWAPSGSGSLEPVDVLGADHPTLDSAVRRGMDRELVEECCLDPQEVVSTRVIGYARWLDRGGKPEFLGVTVLGVDAATVLARARARRDEERLWTSDVIAAAFDPTSKTIDDASTDRSLQYVLGSDSRFAGSVSVPLELCCRALVRLLQREPSALEALRHPSRPDEVPLP